MKAILPAPSLIRFAYDDMTAETSKSTPLDVVPWATVKKLLGPVKARLPLRVAVVELALVEIVPPLVSDNTPTPVVTEPPV